MPAERISSSARSRRPDHQMVQENAESEITYSRLLHAAYYNNLNAFCKIHRGILCDIEKPSRIILSPEEVQLQQSQLDKMYKQVGSKMVRQHLLRNVNIHRSQEQYMEKFVGTKRDLLLEDEIGAESPKEGCCLSNNCRIDLNPETNQTIDFIKTAEGFREQSRCRKDNHQRLLLSQEFVRSEQSRIGKSFLQTAKEPALSKKRPSSTFQSPFKRRPQSSRVQQPRSLLLQIKTITSKSFERKPSNDRNFRLKRKSFQCNEEFIFSSNQILINQRKTPTAVKQSEFLSQTESIQQIYVAQGPQNIHYRHLFRKSIEEQEKEQIQNKILKLNPALSVSLPQTQGYRPKSKCWENSAR